LQNTSRNTHRTFCERVKSNMQNSYEFQTGSVMDKNKIGKRCALTEEKTGCMWN